MNEDTIKAIEEQLRLRNERLALREKEFGLSVKKWRSWGAAFAIVALLGICGMVVYFGGTELGNLSGEISNMSVKRQSENNEGKKPKTTPYTPDGITPGKGIEQQPENNKETSQITLSDNNLVVVSPEKGKNVIVKAESNMISDKWALVVAVIVNGVLVIVGLGVAAFTVKNIANYNNELE